MATPGDKKPKTSETHEWIVRRECPLSATVVFTPLPDTPPALTPGLVRALVRVICNNRDAGSTAAIGSDSCHTEALAS